MAERLIQTRGYNGFSYADIAAELGVTKATLHFHYATKEQLGVRLIERYRERFMEALEGIGGGTLSLPEQLKAYAELYASTLRGQRMCLCGMLAAKYETLPSVVTQVRPCAHSSTRTNSGLPGCSQSGERPRYLCFGIHPRRQRGRSQRCSKVRCCWLGHIRLSTASIPAARAALRELIAPARGS